MAKPFSTIRSAAIDGRLGNPFYRKVQLKRLHDKLVDNAVAIQEAIQQDTCHQQAEVKAEYWLALRCLADCYNSIDPGAFLADEYALANSRDAPHAREPVGIVVVEPAAHAFLFCLISAIAPALVAGNCIIVRLEQTMLAAPRLLTNLMADALDKDIMQVSSARAISDADINHRHVRVLQNGSPEPPLVNHFVSRTDARVVAIVERDADLRAAAEALASARAALQGRSPYAPDLVLVNEWVVKEFLAAVTQCSFRHLKSPRKGTGRNNGGNEPVVELARKEGASIVSAGDYGAVIEVTDRNSRLMQSKIRESSLVIHAVTSLEDAIDVSARLGRLAASFIFTTTPAAAKYLCQFLDTDVSFVNHIPMALLFNPVAPTQNGSKPSTFSRPYDPSLFSLSKPQYVSIPDDSRWLNELLAAPTPTQLKRIEDDATARLPEVKRLKKGRDVGFFHQGVLTGGVVIMSMLVTCAGALGYFMVGFGRGRLRGA